MSVRVKDRNLSHIEYVHNAQQLMLIVQERILKYQRKVESNVKYKHLAKSIYYSIWNSPMFHSRMTYQYVCLANKECDLHNRLCYLNKASQNLMLLETSLETMYSNFKSIIKDKFIILATEKIDYEKKLLKGRKEHIRNIS